MDGLAHTFRSPALLPTRASGTLCPQPRRPCPWGRHASQGDKGLKRGPAWGRRKRPACPTAAATEPAAEPAPAPLSGVKHVVIVSPLALPLLHTLASSTARARCLCLCSCAPRPASSPNHSLLTPGAAPRAADGRHARRGLRAGPRVPGRRRRGGHLRPRPAAPAGCAGHAGGGVWAPARGGARVRRLRRRQRGGAGPVCAARAARPHRRLDQLRRWRAALLGR